MVGSARRSSNWSMGSEASNSIWMARGTVLFAGRIVLASLNAGNHTWSTGCLKKSGLQRLPWPTGTFSRFGLPRDCRTIRLHRRLEPRFSQVALRRSGLDACQRRSVAESTPTITFSVATLTPPTTYHLPPTTCHLPSTTNDTARRSLQDPGLSGIVFSSHDRRAESSTARLH